MRAKKVERVIDTFGARERDALEESLLSLIHGFCLRHAVPDKVLCDVLQDVTDWLACPRQARRVFLRSALPDDFDQSAESEVS